MISEVVTTESIRWLELVINIQETSIVILIASLVLVLLDGDEGDEEAPPYSESTQIYIAAAIVLCLLALFVSTLFRIWL